ncbi:unnamed protein product [Adineta steineri]|uniref:Uncharacterized protein n=1 Tax=Adineta steineri TaxID=433720 RepID=A0A815YGV5_9BILA|nr:unnamed protein product [Adineta steineri]CAF1570704.1 unnamed protein product [Adineta steineri]CAF1627453.1 unnamed protein product [Adineta steineri]CAF1668825.1 unnamed protein product [Adineta steineri]
MSDRPQTMLMKLVFKRAPVMREPYRGSHWTIIETSKINKKESSVHKRKEKAESLNKTNKIVQKTSPSSSSLIEKVAISLKNIRR